MLSIKLLLFIPWLPIPIWSKLRALQKLVYFAQAFVEDNQWPETFSPKVQSES